MLECENSRSMSFFWILIGLVAAMYWKVGKFMENYRDKAVYNNRQGMNPDAQEAKRLRNQLVEYDGYLQEMRKSTMKNVETLDVIQRYTDKSSEGIQNLTEESAAGMQKLVDESLLGVQKLTEESLKRIAELTEESLGKIEEVNQRNVETAKQVEAIRELMVAQTMALQEMHKASDELSHKENVKVYRNVQAVVVEEVKKQSDDLKKNWKGVKPLLVVTLLAALANVALFVLQILGILAV